MNKSPSAMPVRKVAIGATTGSIVTIIIWGLKQYANVDVPGEVAAALTVILTFIASYWIPPEGMSELPTS